MPRPYPPEFRQRALNLVRSGRPVPEVAKLLGIAESCLYRWKKQDLVDRGLEPGTSRAESAELAAARQKIRDLEEENKILRKAAAAVREVVPPKGRYRLVAELHADGVRVRQACYVLDVSPSGYYDWKTRAPSARPVRHAWLTDLTGQVRDASYGTYGQPRASAGLRRAHGLVAGRNTVMLLMRRAGISGLPLRRRAKRVPAQKTVTDLVKRQFTADGPNRLWVTDITEHPTREGKACCCVVIDVFSRRVAGWSTGTAQRSDLATNALGMATGSRRPSPGAVIHGDYGTQGGFNRPSQRCSFNRSQGTR
jgi:transposase-like protein